MSTRDRKHHDASDEEEYAVRRTLAPPSSDMNVTPLIDVLLVMLVIFLAALPLTQRGHDINLPLEVNAKTKPQDNIQVVIEYSASRVLTINKRVTTLEALTPDLRAIFEARTDKTVFVSGDGTLRYGEVIAVIDAAIGLGLKVGVTTDGMRAEARAQQGS